MKRLIFYFILSVGLFILLFSACTTNADTSRIITKTPATIKIPDIKDGGFLSGDPCGPPCFLKIIPGETDKATALNILQAYYDIQNCEYWDRNVSGGYRAMGCLHTTSIWYRLALNFSKQDIVDGLSFMPTQNISVQDVVAKYGGPDGVDVITWSPENIFPPLNKAVLNYVQMHTRLYLPIAEGEKYPILPSSQIETIDYEYSPLEMTGSIQTWLGYGEYPVNIP
jgi:hypothetical protein